MKRKPSVKVVYRRDKGKYVLRWTDSTTGAAKERTTPAKTRREADRLAGEFQSALAEGRYREPDRMLWADFRLAYERDRVGGFKHSSQTSYATSLNHVERIVRPNRVGDLDATSINYLQTRMRSEGLAETTIARHLRHVKAALNWGVRIGVVSEMPAIVMPRRVRRGRQMRGRPLSESESEKNQMVAACNRVRPQDASDWKELVEGLWLSGLRLSESLNLSWDEGTPLSIDLSGKRPALRILAEGEKGFRDRLIPLVPDFAKFIAELPSAKLGGHVFALGRRGLTKATAGRVISRIGKQADVVVNEQQRKYASAHDLRRSFGTRWAMKVKPVVLMDLMRHSSITTTLTFYVSLECDEVAETLWATEEQKACK